MNLDDINKFKNDLRSYKYNYKKVLEYEKEINEIQRQMENIKSPSLDSPYLPRGDSKTPKLTIYPVDRKPSMIALKDSIRQKQAHYLFFIEQVNKGLDKLELLEQNILIRIYINKEGSRKVLNDLYKGKEEKPYIMKFERYLNELVERAIK